MCLHEFSPSNAEDALLGVKLSVTAGSSKFSKQMESLFQVKYGPQARDDLQVTSPQDVRMDIVFMNDDGNKDVLYVLFPNVNDEEEVFQPADGETASPSKKRSSTKHNSAMMVKVDTPWEELEWVRTFNASRMAQQIAMALREFAIQFIVQSEASTVTETQKVARQQHGAWNTIIEGEAKQVLEFGTQIFMFQHDVAESQLLLNNIRPITISADTSSNPKSTAVINRAGLVLVLFFGSEF